MSDNYYNGFSPAERAASGDYLARMRKEGKWSRHPDKCSACGRTEKPIQRHREDYGQPFSEADDTIHLCTRCHGWVHRRLKNPQGWNRYRAEIRDGWRYTAGKRPQRILGDVPTRFILDEIHEGKLCPDGRIPGNSKVATPIDPKKYAAWKAHKGFLHRISDWTSDNVLIEYPDGTTNRRVRQKS
jgi:hypothetical protein